MHFVPLIYFFAIPFKLFPYPQTLIVLNVFVMSSAAIPLYLIAKHRMGDQRFALLAAALFLWYPTFQYTTLYEFEVLRFSIPILLWMLYAWERQRIGWYYAFVILATLVRDEVGLTVGMFGVYLFLFERRRSHGITTMFIGFVAFAVITGVVMPALRHGMIMHFASGTGFGQFGQTPIAIATGILQHPLRALAEVFEMAKLANLAMLFLPFLFLPFLSPAALFPVLPTFGIALLSDAIVHSSYMLYYVAPAVPFIAWAFVRAWPTVRAWLERAAAIRYAEAITGIVPMAIGVGMLVGMFAVGIAFGPSPIALQFWSDRFRPAPFRTQSFHWSAYRVTDHHRRIEQLVPRIPNDAIVTTQEFLLPRLFTRRGTMVFPQSESRDGRYQADWMLVDATNNALPPESPAYLAATSVQHEVAAGRWSRIASVDGFELFERSPLLWPNRQ